MIPSRRSARYLLFGLLTVHLALLGTIPIPAATPHGAPQAGETLPMSTESQGPAAPQPGAGSASVLPASGSGAAEGRDAVETPGGRRMLVGEADRMGNNAGAFGGTFGEIAAPYLIAKFRGRISSAAHRALAIAGFREVVYLPDDALLLKRPLSMEEGSLAALAREGMGVLVPYLPEDRLSRELTPDTLRSRALSPGGETREVPVMIHVMPGETNDGVVERLARRFLPVIAEGRAGDWGRIVTLLPREAAAEAAREMAEVPEVFFVERIHHIGLLNDRSVGTMQSGVQGSAVAQTPIWNQGIHGEGQIVGEIDTGVDADNCWFRDASLGLPPTNTWSAGGGYGTAVDPTRRKIIGYDFLYSCDQYPGGASCETPSNPTQWDTLFHGTHVGGNMCGDSDASPIVHDAADGIAPGAKFVPQDAGYSVDACADLPGVGCPVIDTYPLFEQAWRQGVRLHNNSYGDNENAAAPNQSNYTARSQDIDRFMWDHRDFLIFHAAGNSGAGSADFSVGSPSTNKNGLSIGSARTSATSTSDENISSFSSRGWTGDGRIKPDVMAPGCNVSAGNNSNVTVTNCNTDSGCGTSYASPTAAGAAALARQYFTEGFYPSGARTPADGMAPSAALVKGGLINSAVTMTGTDNSGGGISPIPSNEQGWGRVRLDRTLLFNPPARRLYVDDHRIGLTAGATAPFTYSLSSVGGSEPLKVTLTWTDYPAAPDSPPAAPTIGNPLSWSAPRLVNDLDLTVSGPSGTFRGNVFSSGASTTGGSADRRNNVEQVLIPVPMAGTYTVTVTPFNIVQGGQEFALVATGAWGGVADCSPGIPAGLTVTSSTATSVSMDWMPGAPAGASYRVWRTSGDCVEGPWTLVGTPAAPPFTDSGLSPGTTYLYRVSALSADARCESRRTACVVGMCGSPPVFAGASGATTDGGPSCGITVSWPPASSACPGGSLVYNLYRDANPSFTPGPGNLLARCLSGASYHDTAQLVSGSPVTYVVRAEDSRMAGGGACSGGVSDANTKRVTATPAGAPQVVFGDGFESGLGNWIATQWTADGTVAHSGLFSAHSANTSNLCATLELASPFSLPAGSPYLGYSARWLIEPGYDGGVVEVATAPTYSNWTILTPSPSYPGSRNTSASACLPVNTPCYTGSSSSFADATASLAAYAGQPVKVRFRYSSDGGVNNGGFWVDDIAIAVPMVCATTVGEVSAASTPTPLLLARLPGGSLRARFQKLPGAQTYNLYEGMAFAGSFYSHAGSPGNRCSAAVTDPGDGTLIFDFTPSAGGSLYYLVTAAAGGVEGASGYSSSGEIPPADSTCPP